MKKGTTPTDAVRLHAKMTYQPKGKPEVNQDYAPQATDLSAAIPHGTTGVLTLSVDGRYPPNLGEEYQSTWMVDASGEGLKITSLGTQHVNSTILSGDELTWSAQTAGTQIQVKLDATFEKWFQADDHFSGTVVLQLEQSFPDAKVTGPDEVTATYTVTGVIKPFPTNFATITQKALDDIRDFWTRLSPETQDAITTNELPGGDPVYLDGYASTKGRIRENFELGYDRAVAVMKILQKLSGNRADEKLFKTISHGEYDSPAATDAPAEEKDQAEFRAVVIRVTNSRTFTK